LALLLVAGELPSFTTTSLSFAGALLSTIEAFISIAACARTFKFL
jgi:hypothetical protein